MTIFVEGCKIVFTEEKTIMFVSYTFEIEEKTKDKIERIAKQEGRSIASQMRIVLDEYVEKAK